MSYNNFRGRRRGWSGNSYGGGNRSTTNYDSYDDEFSLVTPGRSPPRGGRFFGRGRGSFSLNRPSNSHQTPSVQLDRLSFLDHLVQDKLQDIEISDLNTITGDVRIQNVKPLASYNWVNVDDPVIVVPGSPARWLDKEPPFSVPPDTGLVWKDKASAVLPSARMLPLVVAVEKHTEETGDPPFDWASQDIVTDRNNLKKLILWASDRPSLEDFRIDLQLAGKRTVLMNRWEPETQHEMSGYTYGHNFEEHTMKMPDECRNTKTHHRIIEYEFNGLKMVVQFELDGYLPDKIISTQGAHHRPSRSGTALVDDLADALSQVKFEAPEKVAGLSVVKGGALVSQSSILTVSTKSQRAKTPIDYERLYVQMLFSNTPNLIIGLHSSGQFNEIRRSTFDSPELRSRQQSMQPALRRFRAVLEYIQQKVIKHGQQGRLSLVCKDGVLRLYSRTTANDFLPEEYMTKFDE